MTRRHRGAELREDCLTCSNRNDHFFCDLEQPALRDLMRIGFTSEYPSGSILYAEGEEPRGLYLLCRGAVKLSLSGVDGKTLITRITRPGELLGLSSVLTGNRYKASASTIESSVVNFIRREDFIRALSTHRDLSANAVRQLSVECEADADQIRALGLSHSAAEKLANLLLMWCSQHGKPGETGIRVPLLLTHEDISQIIGTTRETVSRLLKHFRTRGLLSIHGATLTVHKKNELESLVLL
jgi:CRP/FNR family transcriptional regulator